MTNKKEECESTPLFLDFFVHSYCIVLADIVSNHQDLHGNRPGAQGNFNFVTGLDLVNGFHHTAIDADATVIASFVGNGAAFDQPRDLQVLIQAHLT